MDKYRVTLEFTTPLLGTVPKDKNVYETYIANKRDEDRAGNPIDTSDELDTVPEPDNDLEEKGWTGFHTDGDGPFIFDYAFRGMFKEACSSLRRVSSTKSSKLRAYKKVIDGLVFVEPRRVHLDLSGGVYDDQSEVAWNGSGLGVLERPLRAQTAQGERVALARSDCAPPGASVTFDVVVMGQVTEGLLREFLNYGMYKGMGQWRGSGGYGRFTYEMEKIE